VAAGLVGVFGFSPAANAATIATGCSTTTPNPTKSGNVISTTFVVTCSNSNIDGGAFFLKLWRYDGNGEYAGVTTTEIAEGANFTRASITSRHTCSATSTHSWHAELYGDVQYTTGIVDFNPVNSTGVSLACS
jgi:hypothetical protein